MILKALKLPLEFLNSFQLILERIRKFIQSWPGFSFGIFLSFVGFFLFSYLIHFLYPSSGEVDFGFFHFFLLAVLILISAVEIIFLGIKLQFHEFYSYYASGLIYDDFNKLIPIHKICVFIFIFSFLLFSLIQLMGKLL